MQRRKLRHNIITALLRKRSNKQPFNEIKGKRIKSSSSTILHLWEYTQQFRTDLLCAHR